MIKSHESDFNMAFRGIIAGRKMWEKKLFSVAFFSSHNFHFVACNFISKWEFLAERKMSLPAQVIFQNIISVD